MKYVLFIFVLIYSSSGISQETKITIATAIYEEEEISDENDFSFHIEGTEYIFFYDFNYKYNIPKTTHNPNIYAYMGEILKDSTYNIAVSFKTKDSIFEYSHKLQLSEQLTAVSIDCFFGLNENNSTVLKRIEIKKIINKPENIELKILDEPVLMVSPRFRLINNSSDTLYPSLCFNTVNHGQSCASDFLGITYKKDSNGRYTQHSPYQFCDAQDKEESLLVPGEETVVYTSKVNECSPITISEKGQYLYAINVSLSPILNETTPNEKNVFDIKQVYGLSHIYTIK
ncbi:hypothetical protein [Brumimicrobium sp.]|uniref:hypothetical protein n=1 Tax=Brumimicrobium sp. TaxID=2029867 RepID=UPI003A8FC304